MFMNNFVSGDTAQNAYYGRLIQHGAFEAGSLHNFDEISGPVMNAAIYQIQNPTGLSLRDLTLSSFTDLGGGAYSFSVTPPAGSTFYRIKNSVSSSKTIVSSLSFDELNTNTFGVSPTTHQPWFSAANAPNADVPTPTPGSPQTITVHTAGGITGLTAANFSVKAMAPDLAAGTIPGGKANAGGKLIR
jgi:hypothetical protein